VLAPILGAVCLIAIVVVAVGWWRRVRRTRTRRAPP
jgi:hypothetical protein